jgi:hypothetical protein
MKALLNALVGNSLARVLSGAGLSVVSYAVVMPALLAALTLVANSLGGGVADVASIALLSGAGEGLSIVGSAMVARAAIQSAGVGVGKAVAAS